VKVLQPGRYAIPKVSPAFAVIFIGIILLGILLFIFVIW